MALLVLYPLAMSHSALEVAIEMVDLPMKHGDLPIERVDYLWIERDIY